MTCEISAPSLPLGTPFAVYSVRRLSILQSGKNVLFRDFFSTAKDDPARGTHSPPKQGLLPNSLSLWIWKFRFHLDLGFRILVFQRGELKSIGLRLRRAGTDLNVDLTCHSQDLNDLRTY
jgi:hypothetical protein